MCRRCGARLPLEMREARLPTRAALSKRQSPAATRTPPRPGPSDTLLPHAPVSRTAGRGAADTLVPRKTMPTAAKRGAAGAAMAAGVAGFVTLRRMLRRR